MGKYSKYADDELMEMAEYDYGAEEELYSRGYAQDSGRWITETEMSFALGKIILEIALVIALLLGTHFLVAYSIDFQLYVFIGFPITFLLMILGKGTSKFFNILFWIGCWALATRCFPLVFELIEDADYVEYFNAGPGLWEWIKYGFIYAAYAAIIPYLVMKIITFIVAAFMDKEEENSSAKAS
ncbi:hypothetical protein [Neobacillus mesonae]|uniref:hypothetical protein n=1 Tax=Neobacillus mesonae TaxID=1193713 RepID=UPI00203C3A5C|nr:hypothetical protein [Neobacillus mesonae]MCM3568992.1 hypothetical protein [Neobacillus mesonae]